MTRHELALIIIRQYGGKVWHEGPYWNWCKFGNHASASNAMEMLQERFRFVIDIGTWCPTVPLIGFRYRIVTM